MTRFFVFLCLLVAPCLAAEERLGLAKVEPFVLPGYPGKEDETTTQCWLLAFGGLFAYLVGVPAFELGPITSSALKKMFRGSRSLALRRLPL